MNSSDTLSLQGHRLLQIGVALFLFSSLEGFAVPHFAVPSLGRSVHTLSAFSGIILLTLGLLWPRLLRFRARFRFRAKPSPSPRDRPGWRLARARYALHEVCPRS